MKPRTLRGKLTVAYAALLLLGLVLFAGVSFTTVHELRRSTLDVRVETTTRALIALTSSRAGRLIVVGTDRVRFARIVGGLQDGAIIARDGRVLLATVTVIPPGLRALAEDPPPATTLSTIALPHDVVRVGLTPVPRPSEPRGIAIVWRSLRGGDDADREQLVTLALSIPMIVAFALLAGNLVAARGLRPLRALATLTSEIEARDLSRRLEVTEADVRDELMLLCATFNRMLSRLQASFERERRFTSDASHELRAPLAVIRAEADLTLRRPRVRAEYERALRAISAQADRLTALTRDMLSEARAESAARIGECSEVDLGRIAREVIEQLAPLAAERGIALAFRAEDAPLVTSVPDDLRRAVTCVVHNALKFARGAVGLEVCRTADGTASIAITDDGPGFSPAALEHATERFWRDRQVRSSAPTSDAAGSGTGLGLAIAASLVRAGGGTLRFANTPAGGAEVTLAFPGPDSVAPL